MRFVAKIGSFMLDAAIMLFGGAFVGMGAMMLSNDIKTAKKDREDKKHETESAEG